MAAVVKFCYYLLMRTTMEHGCNYRNCTDEYRCDNGVCPVWRSVSHVLSKMRLRHTVWLPSGLHASWAWLQREIPMSWQVSTHRPYENNAQSATDNGCRLLLSESRSQLAETRFTSVGPSRP